MRLEVPQQACAAGKGTAPDAVRVEPSTCSSNGQGTDVRPESCPHDERRAL
jgi:hypothetical protein